jgi:cold shock CspA family protein
VTSPSGAEGRTSGSGKVSAFDEHRGLGEITGTDGTIYPFHCIAIADGTRTIEVGAAVAFEVVPGGLGRWEAATITPEGITPEG